MLQRDTGMNKDPNKLRPRQEDHAADALRYAIMVIYERPETVIRKEPDPDDPNKDNVFDKMVNELRTGKKAFVPQLGVWDF